MSHELYFRTVLGVLAAALYYRRHLVHRRKAGGRHAPEFWLIAAPSLWTLSIIVYIVAGFLPSLDWSLTLPDGVRWAGVGAMAMCLPLSDWAYRALSVHSSKKLELRHDHKLVRIGPYRWVRHPIYATLCLCAVGTCLISGNVLIVATTILTAVVFALRIKPEEELLTARFGNEYREYRRQTGALWPKLL